MKDNWHSYLFSEVNIFDDKYAFYLFQTIYSTGFFKKYITGSVIPFLTKKSVFNAINDFFQTKVNK